jgi:hypothetical protein
MDIYKNVYPYNDMLLLDVIKKDLLKNIISYEDILDKFNKYNVK